MHTHAIVHLVKSNDWLNDYEEQKLGEKILQSQIDNVNITLQNNNTVQNKQGDNYLHKYLSYIDTLHDDKSVEGSLANLQYKSQIEEGEYEKTLDDISKTSKIIMTYEIVTILLIVGAGLAGISEVTKNKLVAYPGFAVGGGVPFCVINFLSLEVSFISISGLYPLKSHGSVLSFIIGNSVVLLLVLASTFLFVSISTLTLPSFS
jgi:hypothetical protein